MKTQSAGKIVIGLFSVLLISILNLNTGCKKPSPSAPTTIYVNPPTSTNTPVTIYIGGTITPTSTGATNTPTPTLPPGAPTYTFTYTPTRTFTPVPGVPTNTFTVTFTRTWTPAVPTNTFTPTSIPAPGISSVSPNPMSGSTNAQQITVYGTNFNSNCYLEFKDTAGNTYLSTSHPSNVVSISSTAFVYDVNNNNDGGTWQVMVVNQVTGLSSSWYSFTVQASVIAPTPTPTSTGINLTPAINSFSPNPMTGSTSGQQITVNGAYFDQSCYLEFQDTLGNIYISTSHPGNVVSQTSSSIVYILNNGNDKGTWHVKVVNSLGLSSSWLAFTVN